MELPEGEEDPFAGIDNTDEAAPPADAEEDPFAGINNDPGAENVAEDDPFAGIDNTGPAEDGDVGA